MATVGTDRFFPVSPSIHQKGTNILMYVKPGQGQSAARQRLGKGAPERRAAAEGRPRERGEAKARRARPRAWTAADAQAFPLAAERTEAARPLHRGGGARSRAAASLWEAPE